MSMTSFKAISTTFYQSVPMGLGTFKNRGYHPYKWGAARNINMAAGVTVTVLGKL